MKVRKAAAGFGLAAKGSFDQILVVSSALPVTAPHQSVPNSLFSIQYTEITFWNSSLVLSIRNRGSYAKNEMIFLSTT